MRILRISTVSLPVLFILGCSSGQNTQPPGVAAPDAAASAAAAPPRSKTVFDPLTQQLDRARDVQNTVDQNSDQTRKAVDNQERGDSPP
jgi:hypothetical protein